MSRLTLARVELTRYRSRRAVVVLMLLTIVASALIAFALIRSSTPPSADERARAERLAAAEAQRPYIQEELAACLEKPRRYFGRKPDDSRLQQKCERAVLPRAEWYLPYAPRLRPVGEIRGTSLAVAGLALLAAMIAAMTYAGADWNSGSIVNQLLATPDRRKLWASKALVVTGVSAAFGLIVMTGWWLAVLAAASARDITLGPEGRADIWWHVLRAGLLVAVAGLGAYALTMLLRSTVGTLAVLAAYAIIGDFLLNVLPIANAERLAITTNGLAWLQGTFDYYSPERCGGSGGFVAYEGGRTRCDPTVVVSQADGGLFLVLLLAAVIGLSLLSFSRRDV